MWLFNYRRASLFGLKFFIWSPAYYMTIAQGEAASRRGSWFTERPVQFYAAKATSLQSAARRLRSYTPETATSTPNLTCLYIGSSIEQNELQ